MWRVSGLFSYLKPTLWLTEINKLSTIQDAYFCPTKWKEAWGQI